MHTSTISPNNTDVTSQDLSTALQIIENRIAELEERNSPEFYSLQDRAARQIDEAGPHELQRLRTLRDQICAAMH